MNTSHAIRTYQHGGPDDYIAKPAARQKAAKALFSVVRRGIVNVHIGQRHALADAAQAHRDLESRNTTGSTLLIP